MDRSDIKRRMNAAAQLILDNIQYLTDLDSFTGDGDHGVTMRKIANKIVESSVQFDEDKPVSEILSDLSWALMNVNGGSAGPLWGAFFEGMAIGAEKPCETQGLFLKNILIGGYAEFAKVSGAVAGEKTMMDAIYPATMVLKSCDIPDEDVFAQMAEAAEKGANSTEHMIAKFGRARNLKERSIGYKDPGAVSFSLFYKGVAER